jgi:large subunit ribosomal protein L6
MSRIGKRPIDVPEGVEVKIAPDSIEVAGARGQLMRSIPSLIEVTLDNGKILVNKRVESKQGRALHGLMRSLIFNMVQGVSEGFQRQLLISGLGYRVQLQGKNLQLAIGYSQPVVVTPPLGIEFEVGQRNLVTIRGANKEQVGQVAAEIRRLRPPEPYKGAGIAYADETIRRKVGKAGV